jgi:hypothetical protein
MTDCPILSSYNDVFKHAVDLFGKRSVIFEDSGKIKIKTSNICIVLFLSTNEYKVYIRNFDMTPEMGDVYLIDKETGVKPRLTDKEAIFSYLNIKKVEDDFLSRNSG